MTDFSKWINEDIEKGIKLHKELIDFYKKSPNEQVLKVQPVLEKFLLELYDEHRLRKLAS